jgi:hypothetical protein
MTSDRKPKVIVTLTRKEADWLLNLLDRETRSNTEGDPACAGASGARGEIRLPSRLLRDRIRAEG